MSSVHNNNDDDRVAEGWIKIQLTQKTLAWLLGGITTFGSGYVTGSMNAQSPVRELPQPEDSPIEFCIREDGGEPLCTTRERD